MKTEITAVKGFKDIFPPESLKRKAVLEIVERWFSLYGFLPIETPIVEYDELMKPSDLASEGEDEAISARFKLQDRGGRNLGLRYEFTFQLSRILKENPNIKLPFKRYQIGPVFRDEPVSAKRFRQFTQCDIDIIGDSSINADAECLACFSDILKELKVKSEIQINNRLLIQSVIESVQIKNTKAVMRELDKTEKLGIDEVKINLKKFGSPNQILTMLKLLEKDLKFFKDNAFSGVNELEELIEKCKSYGLKVKFNPFLIRGLGYYTGNIFEIKEAGKSSIAGGGRYDKTVGKYLPNDLPAVGISFGLERLTDLAQVKLPVQPKVLLISIGQDEETINLAILLRKSKISISIQSGKPSRALDYANALNIPYVIFIGEKEIEQKKFKLKDMKTGTETMLSEKQLASKLKK
nr:histidine--tRNA ligase [Candidatus Pacearchaeota archaeon]